jgi:hypothetical protein
MYIQEKGKQKEQREKSRLSDSFYLISSGIDFFGQYSPSPPSRRKGIRRLNGGTREEFSWWREIARGILILYFTLLETTNIDVGVYYITYQSFWFLM